MAEIKNPPTEVGGIYKSLSPLIRLKLKLHATEVGGISRLSGTPVSSLKLKLHATEVGGISRLSGTNVSRLKLKLHATEAGGIEFTSVTKFRNEVEHQRKNRIDRDELNSLVPI